MHSEEMLCFLKRVFLGVRGGEGVPRFIGPGCQTGLTKNTLKLSYYRQKRITDVNKRKRKLLKYQLM